MFITIVKDKLGDDCETNKDYYIKKTDQLTRT